MDMPDDMILEIFSWLPAKSVCKFKCVNKFYNTVSSEDTYFIQKQSQNALLRDDSCFFLQPNSVQRYGAEIEFHQLHSKNPISGVSHEFLQFLEYYPSCRIVASSKGLILARSDKELFICNPITQSWLPVPTPDFLKEYPDADLKLVLECNTEDSNDFMLLLFEAQDEWASQCHDLKFYSIKEGAWKAIEASFFTGCRPLRFDMHVYHRKAFHFISDCFPFLCNKCPHFRPYIMAYNIEDGSSRMLRIPKEARAGSHDLTCQMGIYKWGKSPSSDQSICLVRLRKKVFTVWVLTDYEVNKWRKILKIRVKAMGTKEEDPIIITGFTVMNGDRLIFTTEKKIYGYGLRQEIYMKLEEICEHGFGRDATRFTAYSDTLRPCGDGAAKLPLLQQQYSSSLV
ncbi:F-box protein At5g65850-like [Prosopis cineraria]|uniref:F-box protein At5g65850-like n=1 Tax=Prosopis cineraria TaxID=364024 RepID=UPI00240FB959|nr:F-box protein At5g65850-like [Prosopis cineraria]